MVMTSPLHVMCGSVSGNHEILITTGSRDLPKQPFCILQLPADIKLKYINHVVVLNKTLYAPDCCDRHTDVCHENHGRYQTLSLTILRISRREIYCKTKNVYQSESLFAPLDK